MCVVPLIKYDHIYEADSFLPPVAACFTFSLPARSTNVRDDVLIAPDALVSDASSSDSAFSFSLLSTTSLVKVKMR